MHWWLTVLLLQACTKSRAPSSSVPATPTASTAVSDPVDSDSLDTAPSGPTGATGTEHTAPTAHTGETGEDLLPLFRKPGEPLEPHARLTSSAGSDSQALATNSAHDLLLVNADLERGKYPDLYEDGLLFYDFQILALDGLPPEGTHDVIDLWDGVTTLSAGPLTATAFFHPQEDANGDGVMDYWFDDRLIPGPVLGGEFFTLDGLLHDYIARLEPADPTDPYSPASDSDVLAAGFDADGDGHHDILVGSGSVESQAFIHYGPFDGIVPSGRHGNATEYSSVNHDDRTCTRGFHFVPNMLGPDQPGVIFGGIDPARSCGVDRTLFPIGLERDTHIPDPLGWLDTTWASILPTGDIDGDGISEYAITWADGREGYVAEGPPSDHVYYQPTIDVHHGVVTHPLGDINGDGLDDFGGAWDGSPGAVVLLSPHPPGPINMSRGVQIPILPHSGDYNLVTTGDFDGDGKTDIVYREHGAATPTLLVYTGAQLTEAWAELHGLPTDSADTADDTSDTATP